MSRTKEDPRDSNFSSENHGPGLGDTDSAEMDIQAPGSAVAEFERVPTPASREPSGLVSLLPLVFFG